MERDNEYSGLFLVCGYVASGKTTVSNELAEYFNSEIIRTDDIRKELFPTELNHGLINLEEDNAPEKIDNWLAGENMESVDFQQVLNPLREYEEFSNIINKYDSRIGIQKEKVYKEAFSKCENSLSRGKSIIFDAAFSNKSPRNKMYDIAKNTGLDNIYILEVLCNEETVVSRLKNRKNGKNLLTSNAKEIEMYRKVKEEFDKSDIESDSPECLNLKRFVYHTDSQKVEFYGEEDKVTNEIRKGVLEPLTERYGRKKGG